MQQAVAAVQTRHGLASTGSTGPATREVLAWPTDPDGGGAATECVPDPDVG